MEKMCQWALSVGWMLRWFDISKVYCISQDHLQTNYTNSSTLSIQTINTFPQLSVWKPIKLFSYTNLFYLLHLILIFNPSGYSESVFYIHKHLVLLLIGYVL